MQIIGILIVGLVSLAFLIFGFLIWTKEKMNLIHEYHCDKVSEKNKKAFCTMFGKGVVLIGIGLTATTVALAITESVLSFIPFAVAFVIGFVVLVKSIKKYNK